MGEKRDVTSTRHTLPSQSPHPEWMDDLWGNAWNDSPKEEEKVTVNPLPTKAAVVESLSTPEVDEEPLWHATETPSWKSESETKAGVWGEDQSPWGATAGSITGGASPRSVSPVSSTGHEPPPSLPPASPKTGIRISSPEPKVPELELRLPPELSTEDLNTPFRPLSPSSPHVVSPDGFGSFETGDDPGADPGWASPRLVKEVAEDPGWGSQSRGQTEPRNDAWAVAQEKQARRNKKVPPAMINALLERWNELEKEMWPPESSQPAAIPDRIEEMEAINKLSDKFLPPLSLSPPVNFATTAIQKHLATTIKLTKSYKLSITSPLAHMRPSNGSDAWENHVKTFTEIDPAQLDQWAVDAAKLPEATPEDKPKSSATDKKSTGWSFWNRKQSSATAPPRPASVGGTKSKVSSPATSARPSVEVSAIAKPVESPVSIVPAIPPVVVPAAASVSPLVEPPKVEDSFDEAPPQPSAVSRFFSRISRSKSSEPTTKINNRHSSFLSSTDIDFLSDVPSYNEEDAGDSLAPLEMMLSTSPPRSSKGPVPPLLAPPPKLNPPPINPPPIKHPRALSLDHKPKTDDDFMDFLSASTEAVTPNAPTQSRTFLHTLPSPLTPSSGSSSGGQTPGPSQSGFPTLQPPSTVSPFSSQRSSTAPPPIKAQQSSLGSLMDFGASPTSLNSPPPPIPPSKFQAHSETAGVRNDEFDDFDSFVSSGTHDDSFNSFTDASFAASSVSERSHQTEEQQHQPDESCDRDVSLFLGSGKPTNSVAIPSPKKQLHNDFSHFVGSSSTKSSSFSPPPQPPSKPSTPITRQNPASTRPSVAKLGATKVTVSHAPGRVATSSPAPLLPPPPGGAIQQRRKTNMMDSPVESSSRITSSSPPPAQVVGNSRTSSTGTIPILPGPFSYGSKPPSSVTPPILPGPKSNGLASPLSAASASMTGIQPSRQTSNSNIPILPHPGTDLYASPTPPIFAGIGKPASPPTLNTSATVTAPKLKGDQGLSAQDLSFFEGL